MSRATRESGYTGKIKQNIKQMNEIIGYRRKIEISNYCLNQRKEESVFDFRLTPKPSL
jgi:hypothetical protein